ncbi:MAG: c-type cytochrome [Acidimicrobiia bacterium]
MTANIITILAVVAGILWLGLMVVSALRNRGGEEVASNLKPGIDDQQLETRRLERGQKVAIACSAFLAISLPLYFLGESNRQEGFVEEFAEESVLRGEHLVTEFGCFNCHGPLGVGGTAVYVEKRSGVTVSWTAPSLDDVLYRYDADELNFWVTYGRGNTPMPAWGLEGGGPMNVNQVDDVVAYLGSIQISQQAALDKVPALLAQQVSRLEGADETLRQAIVNQDQVVKEIDQADADAAFIVPLGESAREIMAARDVGIDTDADGLADIVEQQLTEMSSAAVDYYRVVDPIEMDPTVPDAEKAAEAVAVLEAAAPTDPVLIFNLEAVVEILDTDEITEENPDLDGDGISDNAEVAITGQMAEASAATVPAAIFEVVLDPLNPESVPGVPDLDTANTLAGGIESTAINAAVLVENEERIRPQQEQGLEFLRQSEQDQLWAIDIPGVATEMDVSVEEAERAVALFNANCARCHTASFSAGVPYTGPAGSGSFGPALWDGRPTVQFGTEVEEPTDDLLIDFIIKGSEAQKPYGINGFGSGRMPAFGAILPLEDIVLLGKYLRSANLTGTGEVYVLP